jgi:hypothetical protein
MVLTIAVSLLSNNEHHKYCKDIYNYGIY